MTVDYEGIQRLSKIIGRPAKTLFVLGAGNDPFYIPPFRQSGAEWFAGVWHQLKIPIGYHYRRIHYRLVSLPEPIVTLKGDPYANTSECWKDLNTMARDAVYLGLVPPEAYVDRRNDPAIIYQATSKRAWVDVAFGDPSYSDLEMPDLPVLHLERPAIPQRYMIEIWVEKTTINDIALPLAQRFNVNLQTGVGEISAIQCRDFVGRVAEHGLPTRILYISDFDPGGQSMPVAVARKIEFELQRRDLDADIQVRPIALTPDQCVDLELPRVPLKDTETRATKFEERFGEGATELDALEAIHPGLLGQMIRKEIERYRDPGHDRAVGEMCDEVRNRLDEINQAVRDENSDDIKDLSEEFEEIVASFDAWRERAGPVWKAITDRLNQLKPDLNDMHPKTVWHAAEDLDPLYDSRRGYVEQIDRYKRHQGKPTTRKARKS